MTLGQIAVTVALAAVFWVWRGGHDALSALVGGGIGTAAGLAMAAFMFKGAADPQRIVRNAYTGEVAKLGLTIVLFALVLSFLELAALPLFVTYIAALLVHWVALVKT